MKRLFVKIGFVISVVGLFGPSLAIAQQVSKINTKPADSQNEPTVAKNSLALFIPSTSAQPFKMNTNPPPGDCPVCDLPDKVFVIDASTGETYWYEAGRRVDKTRFGKREKIKVVIINKNPFVYKYKLTVEEKAIPEDAIVTSFLKVFFPIIGGALGRTAIPVLPGDIDLASCPDSKKAAAQQAYRTLLADIERLKLGVTAAATAFNALKDSQVILQSDYNAGVKSISQTKVEPNSAATLCQILCRAAASFRKKLEDAKNQLDPVYISVRTSLEATKRDADAIIAKINDFASRFNECQPKDPNGFGLLTTQTQFAVQQVAKEQQDQLEELSKLNEEYKTMLKTINDLKALDTRPDLLVETKNLGPYDVPTDVLIKLEFKGAEAKPEDPFTEITHTKLNFGGDSRFAISGGIVVGFLERREFKPVLGFQLDEQGNQIPGQTTRTTVIGVTEETRRRVTPIIMLNVRLTNFNITQEFFRGSNFFISAGITGASDNTGTNIEYLLGPSFNFFEKRVFITYGLYAGKVQRLNPNLFLGLPIDASTPADKLIRKDYIFKSGFAVTYKIR